METCKKIPKTNKKEAKQDKIQIITKSLLKKKNYLPDRPRSFSAADCCITERKKKINIFRVADYCMIFKKISIIFSYIYITKIKVV